MSVVQGERSGNTIEERQLRCARSLDCIKTVHECASCVSYIFTYIHMYIYDVYIYMYIYIYIYI